MSWNWNTLELDALLFIIASSKFYCNSPSELFLEAYAAKRLFTWKEVSSSKNIFICFQYDSDYEYNLLIILYLFCITCYMYCTCMQTYLVYLLVSR